MDEERLGIGRLCPHCGVRSDTLGSICPACRRRYDGGSDRLFNSRLFLWLWIGLFGVGAVVLFTNFVAGVLIIALSFVALVTGIGVSNAMSGR
jgi:hypothetical protein